MLPRLLRCCSGLRLLQLHPWLGVLQGNLEAFPEPLWVGEVQGAWVLVLTQLWKVKSLAEDIALGKLLSKRISALIGLDNSVYLIYAVQVRSPLIFPVGRTRN